MASEVPTGLELRSGGQWPINGLWRHVRGCVPTEGRWGERLRRQAWIPGFRDGWSRQKWAKQQEDRPTDPKVPSKPEALRFVIYLGSWASAEGRPGPPPRAAQRPAGPRSTEGSHPLVLAGAPPCLHTWFCSGLRGGEAGRQTHQEVFLTKHFAVNKIKGFSSQLPA